MFSEQCAVCSIQCAVCSVQCAVRSVQCALFSKQCAVCSVQCAVRSVQFAVFRHQVYYTTSRGLCQCVIATGRGKAGESRSEILGQMMDPHVNLSLLLHSLHTDVKLLEIDQIGPWNTDIEQNRTDQSDAKLCRKRRLMALTNRNNLNCLTL